MEKNRIRPITSGKSSRMSYSRQKEVKSIFLVVSESNDRARNLYKSYGFVEEGIRKHYYSNPSENAVLMVCYHI